MSFPLRFQPAFGLAFFLFLQYCPISLAQNAVLTGSINQDNYRPRILTQDAMVGRASMASALPVTAMPTGSLPVTTVRLAPAARPPQYGRRIEYVDRPVVKEVYVRDNRTFFQKHPKVKAVTIGAGVGAGVGAVTGLVTHHSVVKGALIGAGAGAGVGLVRSSDTLKRHPIVRNIATGSLVGLGIGGAASGHGHRRLLQGAGIGAAVGLGASLLNGEFK